MGCWKQVLAVQCRQYVGLLISPPSTGGAEMPAAVSLPTPTTILLWVKLTVLEAQVVLVTLAYLVTRDPLLALLAQLGLVALVCLGSLDFLGAQQLQLARVHRLAREAPRHLSGLPALWHQTVQSFPCCL